MMRKIVWNSSQCDRGNFVMVKGGTYDLDTSKIVVSAETYRAWIEDGLAIPYDKWLKEQEKAKAQEAVVPEVEKETADSVLQDSELTKIKKLETPETPEKEEVDPQVDVVEAVTEYPADADEFPCTYEGCPKHVDPYRTHWNFTRHMKNIHQEVWDSDDEKIVKKG